MSSPIDGGSAFNSDHFLPFTQVLLTPGDPGPGSTFRRQVPSTETWEILYFSFILATSGVVRNRYPYIRIDNSSSADLIMIPTQYPLQWPSGVTERAGWARGRNRDTGVNQPLFGIQSNFSHLPPKLVLTGGMFIEGSIADLDAGDQVASVRLFYRKFSAQSKLLAVI